MKAAIYARVSTLDLDRLPTTKAGALTLDAILEGHEPRIARTVAQEALRTLADAGVQRLGQGKRGSPHRYFRAVDVSAGAQITQCGRNGNDDGPRKEEAVAP